MNAAKNLRAFRPAGMDAFERLNIPTTCQCCGREDLKKTVKMTDGTAIMWMGQGCAQRATGIPRRTFGEMARAAQKVVDDAEYAAREAEHRAHMVRWHAHLDALVPEFKGEIFKQIQKLGGMKAAEVGFAG